MRQLTDSERKTFDLAWLECLGNRRERGNDLDFFESGFISALDHADCQIAALTTANQELQFAFNLAGETCRKLEAERDGLREQLFKATKDLKRMARGWREHAAGDYCQTYNPEMGRGLRRAADSLEEYINDKITGEQE